MADIPGLPNPVATDNEEAYLAMLAGVEGLEMPKIIANNKEFYLRYLVENGGGGGGEVVSVNGKKGVVVLSASDIKAQNTQSIQANLERIDDDVSIRQVTISITEYPESLTDDFLYRITTEITHGGKTYPAGLYQVKDNDLVEIGAGGSGTVTDVQVNGVSVLNDGVANITRGDFVDIVTSVTSDTLVLNDNQEARLGTLATLILTMPSTTGDYYESNLNFASGATATTLTYSATPIIWTGDDCDAEGDFTPSANTSYEISIKKLGTDVVARVGAY